MRYGVFDLPNMKEKGSVSLLNCVFLTGDEYKDLVFGILECMKMELFGCPKDMKA